MMRFILASLLMLTLGVTVFAGDNRQINDLKTQQKALKLQTKLTNTQLEYEKELASLESLRKRAVEINIEANSSVVTGLSTKDAAATAKAANDRVKMLKEVAKINKKLAKGEKKIEGLQKKIEKLQSQIDKLKQRVEFVR